MGVLWGYSNGCGLVDVNKAFHPHLFILPPQTALLQHIKKLSYSFENLYGIKQPNVTCDVPAVSKWGWQMR